MSNYLSGVVLKKLLYVLLLASGVAVPAYAETPLESCYKKAGDQGRRAVGPCLESMLKAAEKEMTAALDQARREAKSLAEVTGRNKSVISLEASQKAFLAYRDAQCRFAMDLVDAGTGAGDTQRDCMVRLTAARALELDPEGRSRGPSFDCTKPLSGSVEEMICRDGALAALDRKLADVYAAAGKIAAMQKPNLLPAEQRGWIKGRNDCWKSDDRRACVESEYARRIAELQARYRLVPPRGPFFWACENNPANEVVVTFFETDPPTAMLERGDQTVVAFSAPAGSGAKYVGRNETFWEHQGEARVTWGHGAPEMRCVQRR